jgi:ADP-ribose pyrophosphatase YjhB (NUDIX family)
MLTAFFLKGWRLIRGPLQWRVLWLLHSKFIAGVSGIVLNDSGQVLLLRHRFWAPGSWGLPGGYANRGERFEETLARELFEETGYRIAVTSLARVVSGYKLRFEITFYAKLNGGALNLDQREVLAADFFSLDNLPEGLLPSHRELIDQLSKSGVLANAQSNGSSGTSSWTAAQ